MAQQKRGLGRGLGALIPAAPQAGPGEAPSAGAGRGDTAGPGADAAGQPSGAAGRPGAAGGSPGGETLAGAYYDEIAIGSVTPNPRQPRQSFDEDLIAELAASISEVGLLQPIVVRRVMPGRHELVMGERRWRAAQQAGLEYIPAIVRVTPDDDMLREALMENLHREQLNPLEEAAAYQQLLDDFGVTHDELARKVSRSRPHISNTLRLLHLSSAVQRRVAAGVLSAGHARALLSLDDQEAQDHLAHRIVAEGLSVRAVEEIVTMGGQVPKPRRAPVRKPLAPALKDLAERLTDAFETPVKVEMGKRKGKIVVEFGSVQDLERIVAAMSADLERSLTA